MELGAFEFEFGALLGLLEGDLDVNSLLLAGALDGLELGSPDGRELGLRLGMPEGRIDGIELGIKDGNSLG